MHTNGPWYYRKTAAKNSMGGIYTTSPHSTIGLIAKIARPFNRVAEQEANAQLIAAAPDLLAALERMVKTFRAGSQDEDGDHPAVAEALSAISKARHNAELNGGVSRPT